MPDNSHSKSAQRAFWSGVFAMTLCVFVLIASEFMPVSLLSPIAKTLRSVREWRDKVLQYQVRLP